MRIGWPEIVLILLIVLIVFGAGKLPQIGGAIGKVITEFRRNVRGDHEEEKSAESGNEGTNKSAADKKLPQP